MKISIFENFDETFKASIDKKTIVTLFDSMNDKNQISSLIGKCSNTKEKQRVLSYISNVLTGNQMTAVKAGVFTYNDRIAYVAYQGYKAVVVAFVTEGRATWKSFTVNLDTSRNRPTDTATILVGNAVEYKEKVQHETDAKITNVYKELEAKIKELEDNAKKDSEKIAELEKRDGAFVKNLRGEKLSFEEEIIIAMTTVSEVAASEKNEVFTISNESTVFSVTKTAENLNDDLIVSIDQSNQTKENEMSECKLDTMTKTELKKEVTKYMNLYAESIKETIKALEDGNKAQKELLELHVHLYRTKNKQGK